MFNIPNLFTAGNMLCGALSILFMFSGRLDLALFAILAGAVFDFLDGFLARKLGVSGELGKQLDSLADMITFGLAPGLMTLQVMVVSIYLDGPHYGMSFTDFAHFQMNNWIGAVFHGVPNSMDASIKYLPFFGLFIPFFSIFRLAKFNIDPRQTESFIGLPTPLNTIFFCFFPLLIWVNFGNEAFFSGWSSSLLDPHLIAAFSVIMSLLLISEIPLFSLKFKSFNWHDNKVRFIFLAFCSLFVLFLGVWAIPLIVLLYLTMSFVFKNINQKK
ncbi:MAG: hypothetical protein RIT43_967 [Bacteroidota bacterium]|jgi:CDP-diacylglycerol--serine O-phosphatidyltransferase